MTEASHVPVLLGRVIELLAPVLSKRGAVVVDATLGLGGHTEAMLQAFEHVRVIGIDRDPAALVRARERLAPYADRITFVQAVYDEIADVVEAAGYSSVSAVLFDLGVSSMHLDFVDRGFSYSKDAPLDMRMSEEDELTAASILNTYSAGELTRILREFGEERFARRIADSIARSREIEPFSNSARLVDLVRESIPAAARRKGGNPAKRTFQALRIEVNDELGALSRALPAAIGQLEVGGRIVVLAYHSLEDRMTKKAFAKVTTSLAPHDLPIVPVELQPKYRLLTRGSEQAGPAEIEDNRRAKSVRLRAVERTAA